MIEKIDGRPVSDAIADAEQFISSATRGWKRARVLEDILQGTPDSEVTLEVSNANGERRAVTARRNTSVDEFYGSGARHAGRPAKVAEVRPGIVYLDIDRVNDADISNALPDLERANGIIVDFRGYPSQVRDIWALFTHMTARPLTSERWHVPIVTRPDREGMTFTFGQWPEAAPRPPRFKARIAFLTDGGAISNAETCLSIVEHYGLGEIVGEPTAGTNGNINPFALPGGYTISWTGMKTLKHDGSQHHGVGIRPTFPAARTVKGIVAGQDEVLEKAIEVVGRR